MSEFKIVPLSPKILKISDSEHFPGADRGFLVRGFICIKVCVWGGGSLCRCYLIFIKYPLKMK